MSTELFRRNDAIAVNGNVLNGQTVDIAITTHGSDFYFAWCAVMGLVGLGVIGASLMKPRTDRIFFYITAAINMTACVAYFTMGSNLGWAPIKVEFMRSWPEVAGRNREIFYARYIDWVITTPLLLMDLLLTAAMPWPSIIWVIFLDWMMIITGLVGALVSTRYKFGFYSFGCAAMFGIFWELAWNGRRHAAQLGKDVHRVFLVCGVWTLFIWLLYPIAWGVCEGGNVIPPDSEAVFYGILDFCAKPVFSIMLIAGHWNISPARLGLHIREFGRSLDPGAPSEKQDHNVNATDTGAGTGTSHLAANPAAIDHRAHTIGNAPMHEDTTTETPPHIPANGQQTV